MVHELVKHLRSAAASAFVLALSISSASAQGCTGQFSGGRLCGNPGTTQAVPGPTYQPVLGIPGSVSGTFGIANGNPGGATVTLANPSATVAYRFNVPAIAGSSGQVLRSGGGGTSPMTWSTATYPATAGAAGTLMQSDGTNWGSTTAAYPSVGTSTGSLLRANGTNWVASTVFWPDTVAQGDLLYGSAASTIAVLAKDTNATRYLSNTGTSNAPAWAQVNLTNGVTGTLPATSGGTGVATVTTGDLIYGSAPNTLANLADIATGNVLLSGGVGAVPSWGQVGLTTHISGILPIANGGTNANSASGTSLDNITGFASTGYIKRTGAGSYSINSPIPGSDLPLPGASSLGGVFSKAAVTHQFLTSISNVDGSVGQAQPSSTDISQTQTGTGAVARTVQTKFTEIVSIDDFGADPTKVADSAPAVRLAIAAVADGGAVVIPTVPAGGGYLMNSCVNNAVFDFSGSLGNKNVSIIGQGWNVKTGGSYGSPQGSVLWWGASIPNTCSMFRFAGTDVVFGGVYRDFAVVASTGTFGTPKGLHTFFVDASASDSFYRDHMAIQNVFMDNTAAGVSVKTFANNTSLSGAFVYGTISYNQLMSINMVETGDGVDIDQNVFGQNASSGAPPAIEYSQFAGATDVRILRNTISNFNGMIVIHSASKTVIALNELEMGNVTNSYGSLIDLKGDGGYAVADTSISDNSISQNSLVANYIPINIQNAVGTTVTNNRIAVPTGSIHINVTASAARTKIDNYNCLTNSVNGACATANVSASTVIAGRTSGTLTNGHCAQFNSTGDIVDSGATCGTDTITLGSTLISGGTIGNILYHAASNFVGEMTTTGSGTVLVLSTAPSITGEAVFTSTATTSTGLLATTVVSAGDYVPAQRWTYAGNASFTNLAAWMRSQGDAAFGSWAAWNATNDRWEYPFTSTYGASLQSFNDNLAGDIIFYTAPSASVTAGNPITFNQRLTINGNGSVVIGSGALSTSATDGFPYIPTSAGTPTGVPTSNTGRVPVVYDTTNHQFWIYDGGWKQPKTPTGAALVTWQ